MQFVWLLIGAQYVVFSLKTVFALPSTCCIHSVCKWISVFQHAVLLAFCMSAFIWVVHLWIWIYLHLESFFAIWMQWILILTVKILYFTALLILCFVIYRIWRFQLCNFLLIIVSVYLFLLSSIYIRRKYWIRENFRLPVFDGFTCFEMSWTRFDHF